MIVTFALLAAMVSITELSEVFLITMLPVPADTFLLKRITKLVFVPTPVALSGGLKLKTVGGEVTTVLGVA